MTQDLKERWISLLVENEVGVLAKVSGLFSGKAYNLKSLAVGTTEDDDVSRMTISTMCNDITFEQIKKQLNRMVEVIKVIDLTVLPVHMKELMYAKVKKLDYQQKDEVLRIAEVFSSGGYFVKPIDIGEDSILLECMLPERRNNELIKLLKKQFAALEVVRGGSVAVESISTSCR